MKVIDVLVVGSANMDLNVQVRNLPERGATILGRGFSTASGGKGANQAVACARMGARTSIISAVGRDEYGPVLRRGLENEGIDLSGAALVDGPSGVALITIEESGQNTIVVIPGANGAVTPQLVAASRGLFADAKVVLVQLEIPMESVVAAAGMGREHGCTVIVNPAPAAEIPTELISLTDIITPNETEAVAITGADSDEAAGKALVERGVGTVIVTRGELGALVVTAAGVQYHEAFKVEAVDATAAGDAFNGALAARLAMGDPVNDALPWALAAGALAATKLGAQPGLPGRVAVERLLG